MTQRQGKSKTEKRSDIQSGPPTQFKNMKQTGVQSLQETIVEHTIQTRVTITPLIRHVYISRAFREEVQPEIEDLVQCGCKNLSSFIVSSTIYCYPNRPDITDIESFPGRVMHSHDFKHPNELKDQTVLVIGAGWSAEDIAVMGVKFGVKKIYLSFYTVPIGMKMANWQRLTCECTRTPDDSVIFATGHQTTLPFLEKELAISKTKSSSGVIQGLYILRAALSVHLGGVKCDLEMASRPRICVIGAGPAGLSAVYQLMRFPDTSDVVCYEKQNTWGGSWNLTWRVVATITCVRTHRKKFSNTRTILSRIISARSLPLGLPEQPFDITSKVKIIDVNFVLAIDLQRDCFKFGDMLQAYEVEYDDDNGVFHVTTADLKTGAVQHKHFSHFIVASNICCYPNRPEIPGIESFPGRVMYSHDFKHPNELKDQTILVIGAGWSAEDIAVMGVKFGAKKMYLSYHTVPIAM
ncbi:GSXL3-like protein [Mya arenaria]|uniref:Flavin-containing monooxygenase n=1 Tax=Mya arenaria TaxID=6604 RepID=A0ABY7FH88_MYAAR|nr:GSXL3-like protein [Mya arenaria]